MFCLFFDVVLCSFALSAERKRPNVPSILVVDSPVTTHPLFDEYLNKEFMNQFTVEDEEGTPTLTQLNTTESKNFQSGEFSRAIHGTQVTGAITIGLKNTKVITFPYIVHRNPYEYSLKQIADDLKRTDSELEKESSDRFKPMGQILDRSPNTKLVNMSVGLSEREVLSTYLDLIGTSSLINVEQLSLFVRRVVNNERKALKALIQAHPGVVFVLAAPGTDEENHQSPSIADLKEPNLLVVGNSWRLKENNSEFVNLAARGGEVLTVDPTLSTYQEFSGSSAATASVTRELAFILEKNKKPLQASELLQVFYKDHVRKYSSANPYVRNGSILNETGLAPGVVELETSAWSSTKFLDKPIDPRNIDSVLRKKWQYDNPLRSRWDVFSVPVAADEQKRRMDFVLSTSLKNGSCQLLFVKASGRKTSAGKIEFDRPVRAETLWPR